MLLDLKFALRSLLKTPGFAAIAVLTLALGIGVNTAIFSMVKSVLLNPFPYPESERLVSLWEDAANSDQYFHHVSISWPDLQAWRRDNRGFAALGGFHEERYRFTGAGEPEMVVGTQANAALFDAIKVSPLLGRVFTAAEDQLGAPPLAVLMHGFWQRQFGGDPAIVGKTLRLNGAAYEVIGVLRPELELLTPATDLVTQLNRLGDTPGWQDRGNHPGIYAIGRLKDGMTFAQAMADLKGISTRLNKDDPQKFSTVAAGAPLVEEAVGNLHGLWLLQGAVGLVLLIVCANLASLMLARGMARESEYAVRAALGASRTQLIRQLLMESLVLAAAGGLLALLFAHWTQAAVVALKPAGVGFFERAQLDLGVLMAAFGLSALATVLMGLWPAWKSARLELRSALQSGGRTGSAGSSASRAREVLIVAEVALTVMLLSGAGLLMKSFLRAQALDLGFDSHGVLSARLELPPQVYDSPEKIRSFYEQLLTRLRALPGVESVDTAVSPPLQTGWQMGYTVEGQPPTDGPMPVAEVNFVSDSYLRTLRIPLLGGQVPDRDEIPENELAIVIDRAAAERHWPNQNPVGKRILFGGNQPATVVGIAPTLRLYGYVKESTMLQATIFAPRKSWIPSNFLLVRTRGNPAAFASAVRNAVHEIDPNQPIWDVRPYDDRVNATFSTARLYTVLLVAFAGLALLLASIGLYGVLAYQVARRTREFGIRIALGALHGQLMQLVLKNGLTLLAVGLLVGLVGALLLGRTLNALLYQTSPLDPMVLIGVMVVLTAIALFASWLPARRATKVDPLVALRAE